MVCSVNMTHICNTRTLVILIVKEKYIQRTYVRESLKNQPKSLNNHIAPCVTSSDSLKITQMLCESLRL